MQHNHLQYVLICNMTNYNVINRNMIKWVPLLYHISITGAMRERERERELLVHQIAEDAVHRKAYLHGIDGGVGLDFLNRSK